VRKVLILNYPHNPTGVLGSMAIYERVVQLAKKYGFMVIHDFAYNKITFDGYVAPSFLQVPGARDVGVEFGSFSKSYNMAGWRLGYCVGNPEMVAGLRKIKGYYDYGIFSAIQSRPFRWPASWLCATATRMSSARLISTRTAATCSARGWNAWIGR